MLPSLRMQGHSSKRPRNTSSPSPATPDGATDHLSSLPDKMAEEILRRLPLDDVVRTSCLAKPWRFRWANCRGLELIAKDTPAAVDFVLTSDLTSLLLKHCDIPALPPAFDGFPGLLELELEYVNFGEDGERTLEALIAKSPSLACLSILFPSISSDDDEENYREWKIRAPNLKILRMSAWEDYGWSVDDLPLIEEACVQLEGPELPRILPGLANVWNLSVED
ncbi:unnamed protein product [Urochloa decumbens]|uniref:F-box domain-containing protein n=1 Tax=Urochloa decumbens TaxID=240449 RepID=A0ABC8VCJ6_9POAL